MGVYRIIVASSRDYDNYDYAEMKLNAILKNIHKNQIIFISGSCDTPGKHTWTRDGKKIYGADGLGERYAYEKGIPVEYYPANWVKYGKKAGPIRNESMAEVGTHAIVFYNGWSKGSKSMVDIAKKHELELREIIVNYVATKNR